MASNTQISPDPRTRPATHSNESTPRLPPGGPLWARLPALRAMTSIVAEPQLQEQVQGCNSPIPPPIVPPDRLSATRILLTDTQACVQKLSTRMDLLGSRSEQMLKEVQLAREALDTAGEKTAAEIADVVYKSQSALSKSIESQAAVLGSISSEIAKLSVSSDAFMRLYEIQNASLASLTQTVQSMTTAMHTLHTQHAQLLGTLSPIEPIVKSIPARIDSLQPLLERAVEHAVEHAVERALRKEPNSAYTHDPGPSEQQAPETPRRTKRKRTMEEAMVTAEVAPARRRFTMVPPSDITEATHVPSSPLLQRAQRRSASLNAGRLPSRGCVALAPNENSSSSSNKQSVVPTPSLRMLVYALQRRDSRRSSSTRAPDPHAASSSPTNKRPRTDSAVHHIAASRGVSMNVADTLGNIASSIPNPTAGGSTTNEIPDATCITWSAAKASSHAHLMNPLRVPLGSKQHPDSAGASVDNGPSGVDKTVAEALPVGSENIRPDVAITKKSGGPSKAKSKTPRKKGGDGAKRRGKAQVKKAVTQPEPAAPALSDGAKQTARAAGSELITDVNVPPKAASPQRTVTGASDGSTSLASVLGPPNSPSTHPRSSPIRPSVSDDALTGDIEHTEQAAATHCESLAADTTANSRRTLISLLDASQESSSLVGLMDGRPEEASALAEALEHVDRDVNFISDPPQEPMQQRDVAAEPAIVEGRSTIIGNVQQVTTPSSVSTTLFRGRPKRFILINDNSSDFGLLDETSNE